MFLRLPKIVFLLLLVSTSAHADEVIPPGGIDLVSPEALFSPGFWGGSGRVEHGTVNVSDGPDFDQAQEIRILEPADEVWDGQITLNLTEAVQAGDVALWYFWMRVTASEDESGAGSLLAMVEQTGSPYTKSTSTTVTASSAWRSYSIPFIFAADYGVGEVQIKFGLGQGRPRTVQVGGLRLVNFETSRTLDELPGTEFTYGGRETDASWRSAAAARIEAHRKRDFSLTFHDESGAPLEADVQGQLVRHAFHFASVIDASTINGTDADSQFYQEKMVELFNASGTENDLKWPPLEGNWGSHFNYDNTVSALEWLRQRGFFLRGHVLVWPGMSNLPNSIKTLLEGSPAEQATVPDRVLDHIAQTVEIYAQWIDEWDVLNEPFTNSTLMDRYEATNPDLMAEWFNEAHAASEGRIGLYMNEYSLVSGLGQNFVKLEATKGTMRRILDDGGALTGMGFQSHFQGSSLTSIPRVYEVLNEFGAEFPNLRFRITEYDVVSEDEQLQADYLRDFMTLVFSHPQVDGFQVWGFWAGRHWRPSAAFFKTDWTPTLQVAAYEERLAAWHSSFDLSSNVSGVVSGRVFRGDYHCTVATDQGTYELHCRLDEGSNHYTINLPAADTITSAVILPTPAPEHWAIAYPTNTSSRYVIETSSDADTWWPQSLPSVGTGNIQVHFFAAPLDPNLLRVVEIPL